jgi:hypothetical protein
MRAVLVAATGLVTQLVRTRALAPLLVQRRAQRATIHKRSRHSRSRRDNLLPPVSHESLGQLVQQARTRRLKTARMRAADAAGRAARAGTPYSDKRCWAQSAIACSSLAGSPVPQRHDRLQTKQRC